MALLDAKNQLQDPSPTLSRPRPTIFHRSHLAPLCPAKGPFHNKKSHEIQRVMPYRNRLCCPHHQRLLSGHQTHTLAFHLLNWSVRRSLTLHLQRGGLSAHAALLRGSAVMRGSWRRMEDQGNFYAYNFVSL